MAVSGTSPTSKERKNLLKQQYRDRKPDMGVFVIRTLDHKHFAIEKADDMKGTLNGSKFKLQMGNHPTGPCRRNGSAWEKKASFSKFWKP
jgi:hypothetical protein